MLKAEIDELTPAVEESEEDEIEEDEIDYESKITVLRYALEQYTNFDTEGDIPESVIEAFVEKIEVSKNCFRWHLRGDFGGDSPIDMNVEGKRKKGAKISPQYIIPPANFGDSGRYQGLIANNKTAFFGRQFFVSNYDCLRQVMMHLRCS